MANPYLILWCDASSNKLYSGWQQNSQAPTPILKQGDEVGVELHWVKKTQLVGSMSEIQFPPSATINLAVGRLDAIPTSGTFKLTYGANTTGDLAFDISAADLQTALNTLASITAEGGVTVTKSGNQFKILWNDAGEYTTELVTNTDSLYPTSSASVVNSRAGTVSVSRIILFKIHQSAIAATSTFTAVETPSISISNVFATTWRLEISPNPKEGVFSITLTEGANTYTTVSISAGADSTEMASALNNIDIVGTGTFSVIKSGDYTWDITAPQSIDNITADSGLVGFSAMYGVLNMNTAQVEEFLAGSTNAEAYIEVQVDVAGEVQTIIQTKVNVLNDLIDSSSFSIVPLPEYMPVDSVVRYDTSQALTTAQQLTARQNINAVTLDDVTDSLDLTNLPTTNEKNAMQHSVLPSTSNPFVTMSERNPFNQSLNTTNSVSFNSLGVATTATTYANRLTITEADGIGLSGSTGEYGVTLTTQGLTFSGSLVGGGTEDVIYGFDGITFPDGSVQIQAFDSNLYLTKTGNLEGLASTSTARINLGLGTMAVETASNYLTKAGNLDGIASASTARTNLGLGTMATETATNYLSKSGNLSGILSTSTARTNIGLGAGDSVQFGNVSTSYVNVNSSIVLLDSAGITLTGASRIQFPDGSTQNKAAVLPTPSDTSLPYMVTWNGSNAIVCGGASGQLYNDQGASYQARYGSYNGKYGSGAIEITEDTWTTSMEMNAKGLKFPDGTVQRTAFDFIDSIDYTSHTWVKLMTTGTATISDGSTAKSLISDTGSSGFYGVKLIETIHPYMNGNTFIIKFGVVSLGYPSEALESSYGFFAGTTSPSALIFGMRSYKDTMTLVDKSEFVYKDASGAYVPIDFVMAVPPKKVVLDGVGNMYFDNDTTPVATDVWTGGITTNSWFGMKYVHGTYHAPDVEWTFGRTIAASGQPVNI